DLNKNGRLDPYEDSRLPVEARVTDLLGRLTLEEKAGLLFQAIAPLDAGGTAGFGLAPATELIASRQMNHFNLLGSADPRVMAVWHNQVQEAAAQTRLGIPVTLSTDPRHAFSANPGASFLAGHFSQWPEPLG